ncbi:MAG: response regulator [Candidatus Aminicenantes bacterium]|nr:response regulator [Candidatus Aminicenantes bacterium]
MVKNQTLLLIDDEQDVMDSLKLWLEDEGYEVHTATSKARALEVLQESTIGVCLIDLKMKDEDGLRISRDLKKTDALLKIIILTGYPSYESAIDAMKMGIFDYVSKEQEKSEILEKIENAVDARQNEIAAKTGMPGNRKNIILVCQHMMIKEGFENFCREETGYKLLHTYATVDFIKNSDFNSQAALVLLCTTCNHKRLQQSQKMFSDLHIFFPNSRLILINSQFSDDEKMELMMMGVKGFLPKNIFKENMKKAFEAILNGEIWASRKLTHNLLNKLIQKTSERQYKEPENWYKLSRREIEILQAMASGLSNFEISEKLFISEKTVKAHINHVFKKMGVKSRTQAVLKAVEAFII